MVRFLRKLLVALVLSIGVAMAEPVTNSMCPPSSAADIRMGTVGNDIWTYWWCRNSTNVWVVWNSWLAEDWKNEIFNSSQAFVVNGTKAYLRTQAWNTTPYVLGPDGTPVGREHLWQSCYAAILADTRKPLPGPANASPPLPQIWVVTPNGGNPNRITSKVVNGAVQAYGSGTQTVKIGQVCDNTKQSYPIGSMTKYLPLLATPEITNEVISCIRIQ